METGYRVLAGIDVHKKMLAVVVRIENGAEVRYEKRRFGATQSEIRHLAAWLGGYGVSEAVLESTAQYWRPVWYGLEAHLKLHLTHPMAVRARQGRKHDFGDAQRLADRLRSREIVESFVPEAQQRRWRLLTRLRVELRGKIGVVRSQVEGLLEEGGIKLSAVASDLFGVSSWAMLERMARGETDPEALVGEARGVLRKKGEQLREALAGQLHQEHRVALSLYLEEARLYTQQIARMDICIAQSMAEYAATIQRLCQLPGVDVTAAQQLIAEIGPEAATFPSPQQLASWVGVCPGKQESAGVNVSSRSAKGNRYLRRLLCQIAWAATHAKGTFFAGLFRRWTTKLGAKAAAWAVAHRMTHMIWRILHDRLVYQERGPTPVSTRSLLRKFRKLCADLQRAGIDPFPALG